MVQVLEDQPSFASQLMRSGMNTGSAFVKALMGERETQKRAAAENEALERMGINLRGVQDPEIRKKIVELSLKGELGSHQKETSIQSALQAIDQLEGLAGKSGIGLTGQLNPFSGARENRGEFESAKAGILPMFKALFPRGFTEREFKVISDKWLPKSSDTEATIRGKLKGLRSIAQRGSEGVPFHQAVSEADSDLKMEEKEEAGGKSAKFVRMRDPEGNLRKVSSKDIKDAQKAGYKVVK